MLVSMLVEEYQEKDHHRNHHQHAPSPAAPGYHHQHAPSPADSGYHIGTQSKYHTQNQQALRTMVHMAEYPVYEGNSV
jgi:hypothetical protein